MCFSVEQIFFNQLVFFKENYEHSRIRTSHRDGGVNYLQASDNRKLIRRGGAPPGAAFIINHYEAKPSFS